MAVLSVHAALGALLLTRDWPGARDTAPPAVLVDLDPVSAQAPADAAAVPAVSEEVEPAPPQASAASEPAAEEALPIAGPQESGAEPPQPAPAPVLRPQPAPAGWSAASSPPPPAPARAKPVPPKPKLVVKRDPEPPPKKVARDPQPKPKPDSKPALKREATGPAPARKAEAKRVPAPASRAAPATAGASVRTASIASQGASPSSTSLPAWHALVRARLQGLQRYPAEAQATGQSGTTIVAFVIDRGGRVLSARIAGSSGSALLDQTSVATVRAASLPPPPADVAGSTFPFSIPLRYSPR